MAARPQGQVPCSLDVTELAVRLGEVEVQRRYIAPTGLGLLLGCAHSSVVKSAASSARRFYVTSSRIALRGRPSSAIADVAQRDFQCGPIGAYLGSGALVRDLRITEARVGTVRSLSNRRLRREDR